MNTLLCRTKVLRFCKICGKPLPAGMSLKAKTHEGRCRRQNNKNLQVSWYRKFKEKKKEGTLKSRLPSRGHASEPKAKVFFKEEKPHQWMHLSPEKFAEKANEFLDKGRVLRKIKRR